MPTVIEVFVNSILVPVSTRVGSGDQVSIPFSIAIFEKSDTPLPIVIILTLKKIKL
jgi:hypothetical protein